MTQGMSRSRRSPRSLAAVAVFCSGQGTNLQALLDAERAGRLGARIVLVVSDRSDARALERAKQAGVEARYINPKQFSTRAEYERALISALEARDVRLVCLAGFMRILSPVFVGHYPNRILNVHPALLPAFPGAHAVRDALRWGARVTGVTVHFVDAEVDHGPILLQEAVPIRSTDTEASVVARIHRVEHRLYPAAVRMMAGGMVSVEGRVARMVRRA